jgi:hypothetical protein
MTNTKTDKNAEYWRRAAAGLARDKIDRPQRSVKREVAAEPGRNRDTSRSYTYTPSEWAEYTKGDDP